MRKRVVITGLGVISPLGLNVEDTWNALIEDEDWQRAGRHAIFGPITFQEKMAFMAEYDRVHLGQIFRVVNRVLGE